MRFRVRHDRLLTGFRLGPLQVWYWHGRGNGWRRMWLLRAINGYYNIGPFEISWGRP